MTLCESCKSTEASGKHRTWPMALAPQNVACREAKSRRPSPARSASAVNTIKGKERDEIEKFEFPKLGGVTGTLAHS